MTDIDSTQDDNYVISIYLSDLIDLIWLIFLIFYIKNAISFMNKSPTANNISK